MTNRNGRILIVDDDKSFRDSAAELLEAHNYVAFKASSGFAAAEILSANHFDIIITDIYMPDGNGIELLNTIRRTNPDLPTVIVVTGDPDAQDREILGLGAHAIFQKPFSMVDLLNEIHKALSPKFSGKKSAARK